MISGIEKALSKRIWFVPGLSIWGTPVDGEIDYLAVEEADSTQTLFFGQLGIGASLQTVSFSELSDHRGNTLPSTIDSPRVMPRSKSDIAVFVVGEESVSNFNIARDAAAVGPGLADLIIIEMGS